MDSGILQEIKSRLPETLRFLKDLVEINSFTENAEGVNANAQRIIRQFSGMGFQESFSPCGEKNTGNHLILDSGGDGPVIACISHLDTVYTIEEEKRNNFVWQEEGDRIFGPGTSDIKGGTALLWMLLSSMASLNPHQFKKARWILLWNAAEEQLAADFGQLCLKKLPPSTKCCLVFEADTSHESCKFSLVDARKGLGKFHIEVAGRGAHAGNKHEEGSNAIRQLARLIEDAESMTDYDKELTVNVGMVSGGSVTNRIPHEAEASLEVRAYDVEGYAAIRQRLFDMQGKASIAAATDGFPCRISVKIENEISPWPKNSATDELLKAWREAASTCGYTLDAVARGGLSDGNRLWSHFPTLDGLGPQGGNFHVSERSADNTKIPEYVDAASFVPKTGINYLALMRLLSE